MKLGTIIYTLIIFAWPLYFLYEHSLGAISFLLLALFFLFIAIKELKKINSESEQPKKEKIKQKNR
jgi:large-conductance mechanosensitive channel